MDEIPEWFDMMELSFLRSVSLKGSDYQKAKKYLPDDKIDGRTRTRAPKLIVYDSFRGYLEKSPIYMKNGTCELWMAASGAGQTAKGNLRHAKLSNVCGWVKHSWDRISNEIIIDSFKTCGISNALDDDDDIDNEIIDINDDNLEDGINDEDLVTYFGKDFEFYGRDDAIDILWNGDKKLGRNGIVERFKHHNERDKENYPIPVVACGTGKSRFLDEIEELLTRNAINCDNEDIRNTFSNMAVINTTYGNGSLANKIDQYIDAEYFRLQRDYDEFSFASFRSLCKKYSTLTDLTLDIALRIVHTDTIKQKNQEINSNPLLVLVLGIDELNKLHDINGRICRDLVNEERCLTYEAFFSSPLLVTLEDTFPAGEVFFLNTSKFVDYDLAIGKDNVSYTKDTKDNADDTKDGEMDIDDDEMETNDGEMDIDDDKMDTDDKMDYKTFDSYTKLDQPVADDNIIYINASGASYDAFQFLKYCEQHSNEANDGLCVCSANEKTICH
ncbi:hypothetical protein RhiirA4_457055 [Rhizophagus irregularis]|uniref:Crinkler family protein n=1 Tax=Rhizophagus irregularis TaxID=588596 RepID=A0A2I1G902_9GLOM|nr:hypothetical protein RhiirA4_457055 [Rhizophagus irregularis]